MRALHVVDGNAHGFAGCPHGCALGEASQADLRPLQVGQHTDGLAGLVGRLSNPVVVLLVISVLAVGEVQARNVHSCVYEPADLLFRGDRGTQGAYNLGSSIHEFEDSPAPLSSLLLR